MTMLYELDLIIL